ncbi:MAG: methyltransferase domain-containing protein [Acidobacteria bacterium]|nr:methyltransferase domain-containing protein [Acidobacteriota bacterium]
MPGWWVDIGAGWGRLLPAYFDPKRNIALIDQNLTALETVARFYPHSNVHLILADAYRLPFRGDAFDAGLSVRTFQQIDTPELLLQEITRVLRPQATFVLNYTNKKSLLRIVRYGLDSFRSEHQAVSDNLFCTHPRYLEELLRRSGLTPLRSRSCGLAEQVIKAGGYLDRLLAKAPFLVPPLALGDRVASHSLGRLGLLPNVFAALRKEGTAPPAAAEPRPGLADVLACPHCRKFPLNTLETGYACSDCDRRFPCQGRILDFRLA